jgi:hypothetical protein
VPALPVVPKVIKTAFIFSDGINTDIVSRVYLEYSGSPPTSSDLSDFASECKVQWAAQLLGSLNQVLTLGRVHCTDLSSDIGAEGDWLGAEVGTATALPVPIDAAVVVSYPIARRYRGGHPRGYWPLLSADSLTSPQSWDSGDIAALSTAFGLIFAAIETGGWTGAGTIQHVNVSYFSGFTVVTNPITHRARNVPTVRATPLVDAITTYVARTRVGTQRRRAQY